MIINTRRISVLENAEVITQEEYRLYRRRCEKNNSLDYLKFEPYRVIYGKEGEREEIFLKAPGKCQHDKVEKFVSRFLSRGEKIYSVDYWG